MLIFTGRGIHFDELREVHPRSKTGVNRIEVRREAVSCDLELARRGRVQLLREGHRIPFRSPSEMPRHYQLCVSLNGDEAVGITALRVVIFLALLFASDEAPHLIALNILHLDVANPGLQEPFALLPDEDKQGKNCSVVKVSDALDGADGTSFNEKLNRLSCPIEGRVHASKRRGMVFCEGLGTLAATVALKSVPVFPEFLAAGVAVVTGHRLAFLRRQADNGFGSALRLTPRADFVPPVVPSYRRDALLPLEISVAFFLFGFDFVLFAKPPKGRINRSHRHRVSGKQESSFFKLISDLHCREPFFWRTAKDVPNRVSQAKPSDTFGVRARRHAQQGPQMMKRLMDRFSFNSDLFQFSFEAQTFFQKLAQSVLKLLDCPFDISVIPAHRQEYTSVYRQTSREISA